MNKIVDALIKALGKFDQEIKPISESDVSKAISSVRDSEESSEPPIQLVAEAMAFDFCEDYQDHITEWETYYGPMFGFSNGDGWPSIKNVTKEIIEYWTDRAKTAKHPVLRARYADLIWDFQRVVTNESPHYSMAHIVIDSIIEIAQKNCYRPEVNVKTKLKRALSLAIALNDDSRIEKVADTIISYEDTITEDSKLGLWGFAYDLLFDNVKVKLTTAQNQKLIDDLEGHLSRASHPTDGKEIDPWEVDAAALRLAKYYRKVGRAADTKRVVDEIGNAFIQASSEATGLQASGWLQHVHTIYKEFGLTDEAEQISIKLREVGEKAKSELKSVSHTVEISKEKMEEYVATLIEGEFDVVLTRVAAHYIPKKSEIETQLKELAQKTPLAFIMPMELIDDKGRPLAKVGSLEEDL